MSETSTPATEHSWKRDFHDDYDMDSLELGSHYDEVVEDLMATCPVSHSKEGTGYWILHRYDDVSQAAQDWETFTSTTGFMPNRPPGMPYWFPVECDPPAHTALRRTLDPFLSAAKVNALEGEVRDQANALIDAFIDDGEVDLAKQFSNPLPTRVFCTSIAGLPVEDMPYLSKCLYDGIAGPVAERATAMTKALEYITGYLEKRAEEPPRGDIVDAILAFEAEDYDFADRAGTLSQLTNGGINTTGAIFTGAIYHLATHPEDRRRLVTEPSLLPRAIKEFLRYYASAPHMARTATRDTEVAGTKIAAGDAVVLHYGAAGRDPEKCPMPSEVDIDRSQNRHLAFGAGPHRCIGAHLARLNLRVGLETFLDRIPEFEIGSGFEEGWQVGVTRDLTSSLPIVFPPR